MTCIGCQKPSLKMSLCMCACCQPGCNIHMFFRCVYLAGELAAVPEGAGEVTACLTLMAEAARHKHYASHVTLLETLCKTLPQLARGLSKRVFKTNLHLFLDSIFYALVNALVSPVTYTPLQLSQLNVAVYRNSGTAPSVYQFVPLLFWWKFYAITEFTSKN